MMLSYFEKIFLVGEMILFFLLILFINEIKFHSLVYVLFLICYIFINVVKMNFYCSITWYSYIFFIVMVGGLMILFIYFTSLNNNQMFMYSKLSLKYISMKMFFLMLIMFSMFYVKNYIMLMDYMENLKLNMVLNMENINMYKNLMMDFFLEVNLYMILYLFYVMVCAVHICSKVKLPMRQLLN